MRTELPIELPVLPTLGVGSYAAPGWFIAMLREARQGRLGAIDLAELMADATEVVVADQIRAGVDVLTDGELRRQRFVYEMYQRLEGIERLPVPRRLGITGYDVAPRFRAAGALAAPHGLGLVEDLGALRAVAGERPVKIALPGPLTLLGSIEPGGREPGSLVADAVGIVQAELQALERSGAAYLQLDEPLLPHPPLAMSLAEAAAVINRALEGLQGLVAVHVCFGNNAGRPFADRRLGRLLEAIEALRCHQILLEFANREMAELELLADLARRFHVAAGVVDVKSFYVETPEDVARRIRACLEHVPAPRLAVTADCGFSALPRYVARRKLEAMAAGARLVRRELEGVKS